MVGILSAVCRAGVTPEPVVTDFGGPSLQDAINGFELHRTGLYWWAGRGLCSDENRSDTRVKLLGAIGANPHSPVSNCVLHVSGVAVAGNFVYYTDVGRIYQKAQWADARDTAREMATPFTPPPPGYETGPITTHGERLYWTSGNGAEFFIHSINLDGTDPRHAHSGVARPIRKIVVRPVIISPTFSEQRILFLTDNGQLLSYDFNLLNRFEVLATDVADFAVRDESQTFGGTRQFFTTVYATTGRNLFPDKPSGSLHSYNLTLGGSARLYPPSGQIVPGGPQLTSVTLDDRNVYVTEQPFTCGLISCALSANQLTIRRASQPVNNPGASVNFQTIAEESEGGTNLRSDGTWLYWMRRNEIWRIRTDAPALELDVEAQDYLEIVQTVQNLNNTVPLVVDKPTFVRAYASLFRNSRGRRYAASAELHGYREGVELLSEEGRPGLPNINNVTIDSSFNLSELRSDLSRSFLFELPPSWVNTPGQLDLVVTVNPNLTIRETFDDPLANNSSTGTGVFTVKGEPCLVFLPVYTLGPEYVLSSPDSGINEILARARALMPILDFQIFTRNHLITQPVYHFPLSIDDEPFDLISGEDSWNEVLWWLNLYTSFEKNPCRQTTHWVGTVHRLGADTTPPFTGGLADIGNDEPEEDLLVLMDPTPGVYAAGGYNTPAGGTYLAHELGHNYGRNHVNCGCPQNCPANPDPAYPYPPCNLDRPFLSSGGTHWGFDPITRSVIPPDSNGDLMAYANPVWISDYTWTALFDRVPGFRRPGQSASLSPAAAVPDNTPVLLVQGVVNPANNTTELWPFYQLPIDTFDRAMVETSLRRGSEPDPNHSYKLRLLDGAGGTLVEATVLLQKTGDTAPGDPLGFLQFVSFPSGTRRIQFISGNSVHAERFISPTSPVLRLAPPMLNAASETFELSWSASDPDGDPLLFTVLYSPGDEGSWRPLKAAYPHVSLRVSTTDLPGSSQARIRVIASDGVNATVATSLPFAIALHAPEISISGVRESQTLPFGSMVTLQGLALDAEEGSLAANRLHWQLTGPTIKTATGSALTLAEALPGSYTATLTATDSDGQTGNAVRHFTISSPIVPEGLAPLLDGEIADDAYTNALFIRLPLGTGAFAQARFVHSDSALYIGLSELSYGDGPSARAQVGLRIDPSPSNASTPQPDDQGFYIDQNGLPSQLIGNGSTMIINLAPAPGFEAVISRGGTAWSTEMRIADHLVGGWNHLANVVLSHSGLGSPNEERYWPGGANIDQPSSWGPISFGPLPAPPNARPMAATGPKREYAITMARTIYLNGAASFDPEGGPLIYSWTQTSGPEVTLNHATSSTPSFVTQTVTNVTELSFALRVQDDRGEFSETAHAFVTLVPTVTQRLERQEIAAWRYPDGSFVGRLLWPGAAGDRVEIEASTNLQDWVTINTSTVDFYRSIYVIESDMRRYSQRFYRAKETRGHTNTIYSTDFESGAGPEWSDRTTAITPAGNRVFLGEFGPQTVRLSLADLPVHQSIAVSFDLFILKSWDGNRMDFGPDIFDLSVAGGISLLSTTFSPYTEQAFPGPLGAINSPRTGAVENNTLGYTHPNLGPADAVYRLTFTFEHLAPTVELDFRGVNLQTPDDESWGLDNVRVETIDVP